VPASESWTDPGGLHVEDVELHTPGGTRIHAWWCPVPGSTGALLYAHGKAGNLSHRVCNVALLQSLGESVLVFDYPGFGRSGGSPSESGCYAAADAAYDWLTQTRGIPAERILLFGRSLGGGVVTDLAVRRPHRALILCKTFTSIPDVASEHVPWVPTGLLMHNRFDSLAKIGRCTRPVFVCHGTGDRRIACAEAERLFAAALEPKRLFLMPGEPHDGPILTGDCLDALRHFLAQTAP
jgi:fermentation-respiration switch protein FrsA (DUF1100 family)